MPASDGLGSWSNLGTISMTDDWQYFPTPVLGSISVLRITYTGDWKRRYGLIRLDYLVAEQLTVSQALRVYPKIEQQIVKFEVPMLTVVHSMQAKQVFRSFRDTYLTAEDSTWTMQVEVLQQ